MPAFITFGRILFAVIFIASGASKFLDLGGTAEMIAGKVVFPEIATPYVTQLQTLTGMEMKQMLAIAAGTVELLGGILIALNIGARFFAMVLVLFVIAATFYFHAFWNQTGPEATNNMIHALKNLSLIGGLFMIAGIGRGPRIESAYTEV
ncbi:MAG: DoxX [Tardiphaga sp.]|nr:DoxX [Tardiphaga sp.]